MVRARPRKKGRGGFVTPPRGGGREEKISESIKRAGSALPLLAELTRLWQHVPHEAAVAPLLPDQIRVVRGLHEILLAFFF